MPLLIATDEEIQVRAGEEIIPELEAMWEVAPESMTHSPEGGPCTVKLFMPAINPEESHDGVEDDGVCGVA